MNFNPLKYNYSSRRNVVISKKGMVATSQPLAAQAGLEMLQKGGNAIDAAIATAACLTVVEPCSNGIGGDAFALVWVKDKLHGLNASGPAPKAISVNVLKDKGFNEIPKYGFIPVTVPGAPSAWVELSKRFGKLSLIEVLSPAIRYASEGFPLSISVAKAWERSYNNFKKLTGDEYKYWFETFCPLDKPVRSGEIWKSEAHAKTLKSIAETYGESFYRGEFANKIDEFSRNYGGYIRKEDMIDFRPEWVNPVSVEYRGYNVWEIPPNGHGIAALMALNIVSGIKFGEKETAETYHIQIEAMKLAFADAQKYVADPRFMSVKIEELLSQDYAAERRKLIGDNAMTPMAGEPAKGGTVYLAAADEEGNMVSYIQSNYMGFGSGLVVPGTGIALHNRGNNFCLDEKHDNCIVPGKKPYHTIIPGFLTNDGKAVGPFGVMGGFMQPQGHLQVVMNLVDFNLNPQDTLDAPRWQWVKDKTVLVEQSFPSCIAEELAKRGHNIVYEADSTTFGRGQIIWRTTDGTLVGGTEPRTDGYIAVW